MRRQQWILLGWLMVGVMAPALVAHAQFVPFPAERHSYTFLDLPLDGQFGNVIVFDVTEEGALVGTRTNGSTEAPFLLTSLTRVAPVRCAPDARTSPRHLTRTLQVIGTCTGVQVQAFVTSKRGLPPVTLFSVPGASVTRGEGGNERGTIVGTYFDAHGLGPYGFIHRGRATQTVNIPGHQGTVLQGINNFGVSVGYTHTPDGRTQGLVVVGETTTLVDAPGATDTFFWEINDQGHILGLAIFPDHTGASLLIRDGQFEVLTVPGPGVVFVDVAGLGGGDQIAGRVLLEQPNDPLQPVVSRGFVVAPLPPDLVEVTAKRLPIAATPVVPGAARIALDGCIPEGAGVIVPLRLQGVCGP